MACTSTGAIARAEIQAIQLNIKLANVPWLNCGICAEPPATGSSTDNSAKVRAIKAIAMPAIINENTTGGPAILAAYKGANSQAEPTIPLILIMKRLRGEKRRLISMLYSLSQIKARLWDVPLSTPTCVVFLY